MNEKVQQEGLGYRVEKTHGDTGVFTRLKLVASWVELGFCVGMEAFG